MSLRGLFYLEPVVILDPTMNTPRDAEPFNGNDVASPTISNSQTEVCESLIATSTKGGSDTTSKPEIKPKVSKKRSFKNEHAIRIGDNEYVRPPSIHDKYAARPDSLEHICLAQFVIWYESVPKTSKSRKKQAESLSEHEIICPHLETPTYMPNYINLKVPEL